MNSEFSSGGGIKIPDHSMPSDYSDVHPKSYDPEFISQISSQMQVPERIAMSPARDEDDHPISSVRPGGGGVGGERGGNYQYNGMTVPDRILVAGDNQHIGVKSDLALHLRPQEPGNTEALSYVGLLTPPRTLTMEESFPVVEEGEDGMEPGELSSSRLPAAMVAAKTANGHVVPPSPYDPGVNPHDSLLLNEEDEVTLLRTQMSKLARRVQVIEEEHKKRSQRELVVYPFVFGYLLWKVLGWLARDSR